MTTETPTTERVLIGAKDVMRMLDIGRTTLHRVRNKDSTFPKPIKDSPHRQARAYFVKSEVETWIKSKADSRHSLQVSPFTPDFPEQLTDATTAWRGILMEQHRTALVGNAEVMKMLGMKSVSGLNKLRVRDKTFPAPIKTSDARGARCRFDPIEVEQWIAGKKAARSQSSVTDR